MWLTRDDLNDHIGNIPPTFQVERHLGSIIKKVVQGWLVDLLGAKLVAALNDDTGLGYEDPDNSATDELKDIRAALKPFLANAVWSLFLLQGNVEYSDTGPVQRMADSAVEPISDRQRAELSRLYKDHAERYALMLVSAVNQANTDQCGASVSSGRPRIISVGGRRRSRFT